MKLNQRFSIDAAKLQITKPINHIKEPCSHGGARKCGYVRADSTVTLSVLHIAITQTRLHLQSALCRSTQFATSLNNALSHRYRPASCIVDIDWLEVWVELVVGGRNEDYRDAHLTE